mgnify:CR=1 FL=1
MKISIYKTYLFKKFSKKILMIGSIFFSLIVIINLVEEINFLKDSNTNFLIPIILTLLNAPTLVYEVLPFIFLIATQFFFIEIIESKEFYTLKHFGLNNFKILKLISLISFAFGLVTIILFYNFAAVLKNQYLLIKNDYSNDNKYLAVITENGLWIRDALKDQITIINADKISGKFLLNASITQFNSNYEIQQNMIAKKINVKEKKWILYDVMVAEKNNNTLDFKEKIYNSNFDLEKINSLFSNLSSLTFFELIKLKKDYKLIGYSTNDIDIQLNKIYIYPFFLTIMSIIASIIMINIKYQKNMMTNLFIGIFLSVLIYYINHFSNLLGSNNILPLKLSVWFPLIILSMLSFIGLVKINEK